MAQAFAEIYPSEEYEAILVDKITAPDGTEMVGCTTFPDDGTLPLIEVAGHIPAGAVPEVLAHELDDFSAPMTALRKETMAWFRYYSQLDDVACELRENENGYFSDEECGLFRLFEERVIRLREESQLLREYCTQIQSLFQSEIDIRQNRIMQILTIVTTIFLPLTLLVGWYGMNFSGMPELHWKYGYPAIILVSIAVVVLSLWVCKKKKFW